MLDTEKTAAAYPETWNETSDERRSEVLARHWTEDASYVDPLMSGNGHTQISGLVAAVEQLFPGFRFTLIGTPNGYGDYLRLSC